MVTRSGAASGPVLLSGALWLGGDVLPLPAGAVLIDGSGRVAAAGRADQVDVPAGVRRLGGPGSWVGPGIVDAHVHLAFGSPDAELRGGLVGVRDLGAPPSDALAWQTAEARAGSPAVAVAGPVLTAPRGYPSASWGAGGFAAFLGSPAQARRLVAALAADGVDLVKVALEPAGGPVPTIDTVRAVVDAAHDAGLAVTAHALSRDMVHRALDAGVDELCHTPTEPLQPADVERIARAGVPVVSTIQTMVSGGGPAGAVAVANARALVAAGVRLVYGTDLGNAGTATGVDPRELERLAEAGLGRLGALRAATALAAAAPGMRGPTGRVTVGEPANLVLLRGDPLADPELWRRPTAVVAGGVLTEL